VRRPRRWKAAIFDWFVRDPRQQAIVSFLANGLAGSGTHRVVFLGYAGFGVAILLSGMIGMLNLVEPARLVAARFVYAHVILLTFLMLGLRHLFSIPLELRANWLFHLTEGQGRVSWMKAVDRLVLTCAAAMALLPFPLEAWLLGWRAVSEMALFAAFGLVCYEAVFRSWEKLPLTCSYLPGKQLMWMVALKLFGLLALLPVINAVLLACLYSPVLYTCVLLILLAVWVRLFRPRRQAWGELRLRFEEAPDPEIHTLNLLR
jgi:hypothetical protein